MPNKADSLSVPAAADRRLPLAATDKKSFSVKDSAPKRLTLLLLLLCRAI